MADVEKMVLVQNAGKIARKNKKAQNYWGKEEGSISSLCIFCEPVRVE